MNSEEMLGKHNREMLRDLRGSLTEFGKTTGVVRVGIKHGRDACPACVALSGQTFTIVETVATNPLPCRECSGHWVGGPAGACRCEYRPI